MKIKSCILLLALIIISVANAQNQNNPLITAYEIQDHINFLASDTLEGRFTGSAGADKAADYISKDFKTSGLIPLNDDSYFQYFPFVAGLKLSGNNSLLFVTENKIDELKLNQDYTPTPFTGNYSAKGDLVFAGYGISASELNYDDYKDINVKDKIVIVLRYHPESDNPHSKFDKFAAYRYKAKIAKEKGAKGIIFTNGFFPKNDEDKLMELKYDGASGMDSICAVQVKRDIISKLFSVNKFDLRSIQEKIDSTKTPDSFILKNSTTEISTGIKEIEKEGKNVIGLLKSNNKSYSDQYVVIGAHYDHLGYGNVGSLYRGKEKLIHNGADDNASGIAGTLELAEKFASVKNQLKRSIIFIAFAGEELGLLGSSYFANHSLVGTNKIISMINLDMVGRLKEDTSLIVYGAGTSSIWKNLLEKNNSKYNFNLTLKDDGYGPSDHSSFYAKDIPVLFFFTGTHSDYHRPSDDADKINSKGEEKILNYVYNIVTTIDTNSLKPDYINVPRKSEGRMAFKVYVGTIPDYSGQDKGLKITGVSEGSPAQKAGLKGGDIIVNFGGKKIENIYDYTYALGDFTPGEIVDVIVNRKGKEIKMKVELGTR